MRRAGPTSHVYFSQRLRLHYVDWGNEDAPPMLLVHGGRDHCRNWDWVAEELSRDYHGHRAGPARPRRFPVDDRRGLQPSRLRLRHRATAAPDEDDAGDDHRALPRRVGVPGLLRRLPGDRDEAGLHRGHGAAAAHDGRGATNFRPTNACRAGWTTSASFPDACPGATRRWRKHSNGCRPRTRISPRPRRATSPSTAATRTRTVPIAGSSTTTCAPSRPSACRPNRPKRCTRASPVRRS